MPRITLTSLDQSTRLPKARYRLCLHRVDLDQYLAKGSVNDLLVPSRPSDTAERGKKFEYPLVVALKRGQVPVRIEAAPGRAVGDAGRGCDLANPGRIRRAGNPDDPRTHRPVGAEGLSRLRDSRPLTALWEIEQLKLTPCATDL